MNDTMNHTTALDPEELANEIKCYPFAKVIPPTVRVLKTPEEIRREADLDTLDANGNFIEKKYSASFRKRLLDKANNGEEVKLATPGKVEIDAGKLCKLEYHIRQCWTARQILAFYPFLHGGKFTSANGRWKRTIYGHATQTYEEDEALTRLFDRLRDICHNYIGAASALEMNGARLRRNCFADAGNGKSLLDFTLNEWHKKLPKGLRERIEKETKPLADKLKTAQGKAKKSSGGQSAADRKNAKLKKKLAEYEKLLKANGLI